jgi:hypothetical protein
MISSIPLALPIVIIVEGGGADLQIKLKVIMVNRKLWVRDCVLGYRKSTIDIFITCKSEMLKYGISTFNYTIKQFWIIHTCCAYIIAASHRCHTNCVQTISMHNDARLINSLRGWNLSNIIFETFYWVFII